MTEKQFDSIIKKYEIETKKMALDELKKGNTIRAKEILQVGKREALYFREIQYKNIYKESYV